MPSGVHLGTTVLEPSPVDANERIASRTQSPAVSRGHSENLLAKAADRFDGWREVPISREQIGGVELISLCEDHEIDRQHDVDGFLDHDRGDPVPARQCGEIPVHSPVDSDSQTAQELLQLLGRRALHAPSLEPTQVNGNSFVGLLDVSQESALVGVEPRAARTIDLADVVARGSPIAISNELARDLREIEHAEPVEPQSPQAVIPVVAVDEDDRSLRHGQLQRRKEPRCVAEPDAGAVKVEPPWRYRRARV